MTTASLPCALRSALLALLLAACSGPASGNDAALAAQIRQALVETPGLRSETVQVQSRDGAVRLSGTADTDEAAAQALAAARSVPGVRDVRNELRVRDPL
ncbi:BON domain-containing protein [Bordetella bronchiseptica]|uniref:BON domain-containing protein n=1 Tax=Bordetella bronchiseptica TaxID=518 RepID=UPI00045A83B0|nr:BON domain-containing protein [Bordetella bronchiseptica]KCV50733.1 BON domain protein [Bordetella bronchiseptica 7E71]KDC58404.1 BON domain protein [Bordetella bronchiseptica MBORD591]